MRAELILLKSIQHKVLVSINNPTLKAMQTQKIEEIASVKRIQWIFNPLQLPCEADARSG